MERVDDCNDDYDLQAFKDYSLMKTPFTREQFLEVFKNYNEAVFPMQIIFYITGFFVIYLTFSRNLKSNKIISGTLAFFWLWMGVVYHFIFFTAINKAAYLFGILFILQGILFLMLGIFQNKLSFSLRNNRFGITGIILITYALVVYPVLGYFFGHIYPYAPTFGLPCPTTIFTFGLLLMLDKKCPVIILIIPSIWSIIGFSAAFNFGIYEDTALLVAGVLTFFMLMFKNRTLRLNNKAL
jgi:hypothetical protein